MDYKIDPPVEMEIEPIHYTVVYKNALGHNRERVIVAYDTEEMRREFKVHFPGRKLLEYSC